MLGSTPAVNSDAWKFLNYMSSNYPNAYLDGGVAATNMKPGEGGDPDRGFYKDASGNMNLTEIFQAIAEAAAGNSGLSNATSTVDIVTNSFKINNHDSAHPHNVCVFTAKYGGKDDSGNDIWASEILAHYSTDTYTIIDKDGNEQVVDVDEAIRADVSETTGLVDVDGFDYGNFWCGPVYNLEQTIDYYQGHKIIILIPIKMSDDAVGGKDVGTNAPGSGIYLGGTTEPLIEFEQPHVSLPINLWIKKEGLQRGESAKFLIQRTTTPNDANSWVNVTSVFVTRPGVNSPTDNPTPVVQLMGLPSTDDHDNEYTYRIVEQDWDWSYSLTNITDGAGTAIGNKEKRSVLSSEIVTNPFIFVNNKKTDNDLRHAESKATNVFTGTPGTTKNGEYDDSKKNTGEGRESASSTSTTNSVAPWKNGAPIQQ